MSSEADMLQPAAAELYPLVTSYAVLTGAPAALNDPVQQRDVSLRVHRPATDEPVPVIVFSHGSMCSPVAYDRLTTAWARRGYAVVMPFHLDAPEALTGAPPDLAALLSSRIRDLSFALDALPTLAADARFAPDPERVAVAGHSFGALTATIKTGLRLRAGEYRYDESPADARFRAVVSLSGVGPLPPLTDDAFAHLSLPLLATGGTEDEGNVGAGPTFPWEWRLSPYALAPSGDKYQLVVTDADHYLGGLLGAERPDATADTEALAWVEAVSSAFLDSYLRGDAAAATWLRTVCADRDDPDHSSAGRAQLEHK